jgi:hypothetical protein
MLRFLKKLISSGFAIIILSSNCFALTTEEVTRFVNEERQHFLTKDIDSIKKGLSANFKYISTTSVDNEIFKDHHSKHEYLKTSEVIFKSNGIFNYYDISIEEVNICEDKANVKSTFKSSFSLDGITQNCIGHADIEIEKENEQLMYQKIEVSAKCNNLKE